MINDKYRGCLLGLAVGDALGTTLEFKRPGTFEPINDMVGGGPFRLKPGQWTDDTSMALCLADSLIHLQEFNPKDQMDRYILWRDRGYLSSNGLCFDIGGTVSSALRTYQQTGDPIAGSTDPHTAGNGSLMRLAPVPLAYARDKDRAIFMSGESSKTTHGAQECVEACMVMGALIVDALHETNKSALFGFVRDTVPVTSPAIQDIMQLQYFTYYNPPTIRGTGYVVESMAAALWAFHNSDNFRDGALLAVNLGDDADTTGAVYGQLAGAYYGVEGIPEEWLAKLALRELIEGFADKLLTISV